jgi:diguanylate cyclase (GGDEF)-like protein
MSTTLRAYLITDGENMVWSHSVFRDSGVAQMVVGPAGRISVANPAAHALVGRSSLAGADLADLVTIADRGCLDAFLAAVTALPAGRSQVLGPIGLADLLRSRQVQMIGSRTRGEAGFDALVVALHEVPDSTGGTGPTAQEDPLTGVGTRAWGLQSLERAAGPGASGCVLVVDLDGFGWINESFGTTEGDRILRQVAARLLRAVPPTATVARIDGDQFLVVSASTPMAGSLELAGVVISALARPMHIAGTRVVTVSVGAAGLAAGGVDEILARAQGALVVAKEQGGQQAVVDGAAMRTFGRRHTDVATALKELATDAQLARSEAALAQVEAALAQGEAAKAQIEARTCPMTGLPNYLAFTEGAHEVQDEARRSGAPVGVIFLDLDQFGTINKTFSWERGTRTLASVARVLLTQCRDPDRVFRYGGEEFVVLLPETDLAGARVAAERLRAAVEAAAIPHRGVPERPIVTLSVGVAAGGGPMLVLADLVNRADEQSQRAKTSGRNQVLPDASTTRSGGGAA